MFLVNREVGEVLEGFFQGSEVGVVRKNLAFHAVGIAERYALEIGEEVEVRRYGCTKAGACQGEHGFFVVGKGILHVPASIAKGGEGEIECVAVVRIIVAFPSTGFTAENAEINVRNVCGILAQIPILELVPLHVEVNVGIGLV